MIYGYWDGWSIVRFATLPGQILDVLNHVFPSLCRTLFITVYKYKYKCYKYIYIHGFAPFTILIHFGCVQPRFAMVYGESAAFDYIAFWCQHPASFAQGRLGQGVHIASTNYWCDARCFFPSDDQNHSTGPIWSFAMRGFNYIQPIVVLNRSFMVPPGASSFFLLGLSRVFLQVLRFYHVFSIPFRSQKISGAAPLSPLRHHDWRPGGAQTLRPHQRHQCGQSRRSCRAGESCLRCTGWGPGPGSVMATLGHDFIGIQYWLVVWNVFYFSI